MNCEDTITLTVQWENLPAGAGGGGAAAGGGGGGGGGLGTAVYTSSWVAPRSDVHSQQRFFYMGQQGEVTVDQAHRGYSVADDCSGFRSVNPLFMKYAPTDGKFAGQGGYGYRSFEVFVDAARALNRGGEAGDWDQEGAALATLAGTYRTTAILEAGRRSLDAGGGAVALLYEDDSEPCRPTGFAPPL
jgi:D-galacturonate reductase